MANSSKTKARRRRFKARKLVPPKPTGGDPGKAFEASGPKRLGLKEWTEQDRAVWNAMSPQRKKFSQIANTEKKGDQTRTDSHGRSSSPRARVAVQKLS
jgi:hypothetical protein